MGIKRFKSTRGQSTIEYILMIVFGSIFAIQVAKFFNTIFVEGFTGLEKNIQVEVATGKGFKAR